MFRGVTKRLAWNGLNKKTNANYLNIYYAIFKNKNKNKNKKHK